MGFSIKTKPDYVVHHYDRDQDGKLDKDGMNHSAIPCNRVISEIWTIVEDKDPAIFKILPSTLEKNMLLMHGMQEEHISPTGEFTDDGIEIREWNIYIVDSILFQCFYELIKFVMKCENEWD